MRIGIDGTQIWQIREGSPSGITTYTVQIINNILKIDRNNFYYIYCFNEAPEQLNKQSSRVFFKIFRSRNRKFWQQTILPIAAFFDRLDLMFFPSNSASVLFPCKTVATIHDLHPQVVHEAFTRVHSPHVHRNYLRSTVNKVYWKQMMKIASKKDRVIAVSEATKRDIVSIFRIPSEKIDVVYEGVDRENFNLNGDKRDLTLFREEYNIPTRYILCMGTHGYKNLDGAIKSFDIVKKKTGDSLKLVIVGLKHVIDEEVFQLIRDLDLESEIIFTGFIPDRDMKYLYRCAELLLFPSFYEGFGLPVLEAFACGTPVVTSNMGSLPEVAGGAGLFVNPYDPENIASAVLTILTDNGLRDEKRQQGFKQVAKFSWEEAGRKMIEVFEKVIAEN